MNVIDLHSTPLKHGIILKVHRKQLLELQTQSKVGITDCKHYFSVITQRYELLLRDWKRYANAALNICSRRFWIAAICPEAISIGETACGKYNGWIFAQ